MTNPFKKPKVKVNLLADQVLNSQPPQTQLGSTSAEPPRSHSLLESLKMEQSKHRAQAEFHQQRAGELQSQIAWLERVTAVMQRYEQIESIINSLRR